MRAGFWSTLGRTRERCAAGDVDVYDALVSVLGREPAAGIAAFLGDFRQAVRALETPQVQAAADILFGGVTDDTFSDFLNWIVLQGRTRYYGILKDPDTLADLWTDLDQPLGWQVEALEGAIHRAYEKRSRRALPEAPEPDAAGCTTRQLRAARRQLPRLAAVRKALGRQAAAGLKRRQAQATKLPPDLGPAFWSVLDAAHAANKKGRAGFAAALEQVLKQRAPERIQAFDAAYRRVLSAFETPLFVAAALLLTEGSEEGDRLCADWVIQCGRRPVEDSLADVDGGLAGLVASQGLPALEEISPLDGAIAAAWLARTGRKLKPAGAARAALPGGQITLALGSLPRLGEAMVASFRF